MTNKNTAEAHKEIALDFLQLVMAGSIDEAYESYVNMHGRHHNVYFSAEFSSLKRGMLEDHAQFPDKRLIVKNILSQGDQVMVHSHLIMKQGEPGRTVVHIFRFEKGKIVELWDVGQVIPLDSPNRIGAF